MTFSYHTRLPYAIFIVWSTGWTRPQVKKLPYPWSLSYSVGVPPRPLSLSIFWLIYYIISSSALPQKCLVSKSGLNFISKCDKYWHWNTVTLGCLISFQRIHSCGTTEKTRNWCKTPASSVDSQGLSLSPTQVYTQYCFWRIQPQAHFSFFSFFLF